MGAACRLQSSDAVPVPFVAVGGGVVPCPTHFLRSGIRIGTAEAKAIASALKDKTSLTHVDLSGMCAGLVCGGQTLWV